MKPPTHPAVPLLAALAALSLAAAGCGTTSNPTTADQAASITHPSTTNKHLQAQVPTVEKIEITSPAVNTSQQLPARYTCNGADTSPPLHITGVPKGTTQLALDILNVEPVNGKLYFDWAVANLPPTLKNIPAGQLPKGATTGINSNGQPHYTLCPPTNKPTHYIAVIFALQHPLNTKPSFNATTTRTQALHNAKYEGFLSFTYTKH
jgi:phosphatidylethanolamine-binding protein (PEBP) family uncharacterized protein